jgi:ubiquinone/menaquinone biosynthesis C-methylase UbiE
LLSENIHPELVRGYAQRLPIKAQSCERVLATFPTEYLVDPSSLAEIARVLTPGGALIVIPAAWIDGTSLIDRSLSTLFRITRQAPPRESASSAALTAPLTNAGFDVRLHQVSVQKSTVLLVEAIKPAPP